ncbi:response regulator transcription factor [Aureivirga sp. CE67]|uniref:response regulator transcription factor n=1 Tax=Aureivirga sp. CE67 TaxID=1788983 RepID=UPI0018CA61F7|nr:response regulator transcription factor [Aureivirga sp. CE67]
MKKIKVILAEDETALGQIIKESLETRDFEVIHCLDGEEALRKFKTEKPEILVLDIMMPLKDGFTLATEIRNLDEQIPIIFLTSKSQTADVVKGFTIGGNDYLKKPFSMEELIVRIHAQLRKNTQKKETSKLGKFDFDYKKQLLKFEEEEIPLTHRESELLYHLLLQRNEILERSEILNKLWGTDDFFTTRSMDVFISKLRKKLKKDPAIQIINVRGFGYKLIF